MRGHFSLNVLDLNHPSRLFFGKLDGGKYGEREGFYVCDVEQRRDVNSRIGMLVAHDVVEHSISHRHSRVVTAEEELKALGAMSFVRPSVDHYFDIGPTMVGVAGSRKLKPAPRMYSKLPNQFDPQYIEDALREYSITDYTAEDVDTIMQHMNFGHWQKHHQFRGSQTKAACTFSLIEHYIEYALRDFETYLHTGISFYFDNEGAVMRHRYKRQPINLY